MLWRFLRVPADYANQIAVHPPLGATTLLFLSLALFWATTHCGTDFVLSRERESPRRRTKRYLKIVTMAATIPLAVSLTCTLFALLIGRWLGRPGSFDTLFSLSVLAAAPQILTWLTYPLRETSLPGLFLWRVLATSLLLITTVRMVETVRVVDHLGWGKALLVASPLLIALWTINLWKIGAGPATPRAAYRWRRVAGKRVVLFYPPGNATAEAQQLAWSFDLLLTRIERLLDVEPLRFRLPIYLGPYDAVGMRLLERGFNFSEAGHVRGYYLPGSLLQERLARSLTQRVVFQQLSFWLPPLLEEGLAEYGILQFVEHSRRAEICLPMPLTTLAYADLFYAISEEAESLYSSQDAKAHAAALIDYLIGRYGIAKFKAFCLQMVEENSRNPAARMEQASRNVFGLSPAQLEQNWRSDWIAPGQLALDLTGRDTV